MLAIIFFLVQTTEWLEKDFSKYMNLMLLFFAFFNQTFSNRKFVFVKTKMLYICRNKAKALSDMFLKKHWHKESVCVKTTATKRRFFVTQCVMQTTVGLQQVPCLE